MGKYLTPKERAKLVISLQLKAMADIAPVEQEGQRNREVDSNSSSLREMKQLLSSCPRHQAREYNFYISLKDYVWERTVDDIRNHVLTLEILSGSIATVRYLMSISPFLSEAIDQLKRLPVIVTKDEYDKAVEETRQYERESVLLLDGYYDLAKQEAYYRLISEGHIKEGDFEAYRDYMENYRHTEDELVQEKIASIKKDILEFQQRKERMGGDKPYFDYAEEYIGLSDKDIEQKVRENYRQDFDRPTKEEYEKWEQTVQEERQHIEKAVEKGTLKKKDSGIEAGSYYDWTERYQKFAGDSDTQRYWNPLHESCMEIGYSDNKVVSSLRAKEGDWRNIIATTIHNVDSMGYAGEDHGQKRLASVIDLLSSLNPITVAEKRFDMEERSVSLHVPEYKQALTEFVSNANKEIQEMVNKIAFIKSVEDGYFDGMAITERGHGENFPTLDDMKDRAMTLAQRHNDGIRSIVFSYNRLHAGFWDYQLAEMDSYLVTVAPPVDNEWVSQEIEQVGHKLRRAD